MGIESVTCKIVKSLAKIKSAKKPLDTILEPLFVFGQKQGGLSKATKFADDSKTLFEHLPVRSLKENFSYELMFDDSVFEKLVPFRKLTLTDKHIRTEFPSKKSFLLLDESYMKSLRKHFIQNIEQPITIGEENKLLNSFRNNWLYNVSAELQDINSLMVILGQRPGAIVNGVGAISGKLPKNIIVHTLASSCSNIKIIFVFNKKVAIKVINQERDFFIRRFNLDKQMSAEDIFNFIVSDKSPWKRPKDFHDVTGILLGYPSTSSKIFQLEQEIGKIDYRDNVPLFKKLLQKQLYSKNSAYSNMSAKFKKDLCKKIDSMEEILFGQDCGIHMDFGIPFVKYTEDPFEIKRIHDGIRKTAKIFDRIKASYEKYDTDDFMLL